MNRFFFFFFLFFFFVVFFFVFFFFFFLPFLFCKFRFNNAMFRYNKNGFVLYTINVREKSTLVCKKNIAKHEKNLFVHVVCWKRTV